MYWIESVNQNLNGDKRWLDQVQMISQEIIENRMALTDLWYADRSAITSKRIDQLIAFAGEGRLLDGNETCRELRELLTAIPSDVISCDVESRLFAERGQIL